MSGRLTSSRIVRALLRRASFDRRSPASMLEMIWPPEKLASPPSVVVAGGYSLRQWTPADQDGYQELMGLAGMPPCPLDYWESHLLYNGFFVVEHDVTRSLVAACFASHHPASRHPRGGNLGWLAAHPQHTGVGLGRTVSAAVTARLIEAGYRAIYLETHDFRLAAIRIYLSLGWIPLLYLPEMAQRWRAICEQLQWPYTPEAWSR